LNETFKRHSEHNTSNKTELELEQIEIDIKAFNSRLNSKLNNTDITRLESLFDDNA